MAYLTVMEFAAKIRIKQRNVIKCKMIDREMCIRDRFSRTISEELSQKLEETNKKMDENNQSTKEELSKKMDENN